MEGRTTPLSDLHLLLNPPSNQVVATFLFNAGIQHACCACAMKLQLCFVCRVKRHRRVVSLVGGVRPPYLCLKYFQNSQATHIHQPATRSAFICWICLCPVTCSKAWWRIPLDCMSRQALVGAKLRPTRCEKRVCSYLAQDSNTSMYACVKPTPCPTEYVCKIGWQEISHTGTRSKPNPLISLPHTLGTLPCPLTVCT
jgi:hypothetical protein